MSDNRSEVLGETFAYHRQDTAYENDVVERNRLLTFRCLNSLTSQQELSAPQVMFYLMKRGSIYPSHMYEDVYGFAFVHELLRQFLALKEMDAVALTTCTKRVSFIPHFRFL